MVSETDGYAESQVILATGKTAMKVNLSTVLIWAGILLGGALIAYTLGHFFHTDWAQAFCYACIATVIFYFVAKSGSNEALYPMCATASVFLVMSPFMMQHQIGWEIASLLMVFALAISLIVSGFISRRSGF